MTEKVETQDIDIEKEINWEREKNDVELIEHAKKITAMMDEAFQGNYVPLKIDELGTIWDNYQAYKTVNNCYNGPKEKITPEFLAGFAEKTHEKLYIHPIFLLWLLKRQLKEEIDFLKADKELTYMADEADYLLKTIPEAMKKVSRSREMYG